MSPSSDYDMDAIIDNASTSIGMMHYKMMAGVCSSVCLSVCLSVV